MYLGTKGGYAAVRPMVERTQKTWKGKFANTYDNKLLLITAIRGYFMGLEQSQLVQPGYTVDLDVDSIEQYLMSRGTNTDEMTEQQLREADTGSHVFIKVRCKILDAIEDIFIEVEIGMRKMQGGNDKCQRQ